MQRPPSRRDGRRSKSLSVPEIFVVETESRHEQATARRMLIPFPFLLLASNLNRDPFNRPAGTGYFPHDSRHFVPGWPFGPAGLDILGHPKGENRIAHGLQPWEDDPERNRPHKEHGGITRYVGGGNWALSWL